MNRTIVDVEARLTEPTLGTGVIRFGKDAVLGGDIHVE